MTPMELRDLIGKHRGDPLELLKGVGGFYHRPEHIEDAPLVGYAGTYSADGEEKHFVGFDYANFARAESLPSVVLSWSRPLFKQLAVVQKELGFRIDVFLGAPEGGKSLADKLAINLECRYVYPNVRKIAQTVNQRPRKEFFWDRHYLAPGQHVVIVEDVANNFSTTEQLVQLVLDANCIPAALVCILNRSPNIEKEFVVPPVTVPIISLERKPMPEYRQDDPAVVKQVQAGNVVWKPKDEWHKLEPYL